MTPTFVVDADAVEEIVRDLFAAMVDGDEGLLLPWLGTRPDLPDAWWTWVDVRGAGVSRVAVGAAHDTAERLARALLMLPAGAPVEAMDVADAMGELANVIGGNVKSLVADSAALTLPAVARGVMPDGGSAVVDLTFDWRGSPLAVTLRELA